MRKIKEPNNVPSGLYDYKVPETKAYFKAHSFGLLVLNVRKNLTANQLSVPQDLARIVEEDWCSRRPEHCYDPDEIKPEPPAQERHNSDMLSQLIAAVAIPSADALATISKALGFHCPTCQRRHKIIKEMKKRGFAETVRLLKETLHA